MNETRGILAGTRCRHTTRHQWLVNRSLGFPKSSTSSSPLWKTTTSARWCWSFEYWHNDWKQGLFPDFNRKYSKVSTFPGPGHPCFKLSTFPGNKDRVGTMLCAFLSRNWGTPVSAPFPVSIQHNIHLMLSLDTWLQSLSWYTASVYALCDSSSAWIRSINRIPMHMQLSPACDTRVCDMCLSSSLLVQCANHAGSQIKYLQVRAPCSIWPAWCMALTLLAQPHAVCPPSWCSPHHTAGWVPQVAVPTPYIILLQQACQHNSSTGIQQALHIHSLSHALSLSLRAMQSSTPTHPHPHPPLGSAGLLAQTCFHRQHMCELLPDTKPHLGTQCSRGRHPFLNAFRFLD